VHIWLFYFLKVLGSIAHVRFTEKIKKGQQQQSTSTVISIMSTSNEDEQFYDAVSNSGNDGNLQQVDIEIHDIGK
jgi:hypothetical protein